MDAKKVKLGTPIVYEGETITEITMSRPNGKMLRRVKPVEGDGSMGLILALVAEMNGLPSSAMDDMDGADVLEVVGEFAPFLEKRTGATQSA